MKFLVLGLVLALWSLTPSTAAAQSTSEEWYEAAEDLRHDAMSRGDLERSREIHFQLIKSGHVRSLIPYAEIQLELGDVEASMRAFQEAADSGDLFAITRIAQAHATGEFGSSSRPEAGVDLLRKLSANTDNRRAILTLAEILTDGEVVEADPAAALALYERLPENPSALRRIADLYMSGALGEVDAEAAIPAYEKAIQLGGVALRTRLAEAHLTLGRYKDALATLEEAVADQDERALLQMVRWHRDGAFGPYSDPGRGAAALDELLRVGAIDAETANKFRVSLASQMLEDGLYDDAAKTLLPALRDHDPRALYRFMRWHVDGRFGPLSDQDAGIAALGELIRIRDVDAAIFASFRLQEDIYAKVLDRDLVLGILAEAVQAEDGAATRALARAYRTADIRGPHRDLVDRYAKQIELDDRVIELVYASHDPSDHLQSRGRAAEILATVGGQAFVSGMMQLRSLERTSYVYVLQVELAKLGYYDGPKNGALTKATIRAMLALCRDSGFLDECRKGPFSKENSQLIVEAVARLKRVSG
jgi:tetratricopeptide (TPR) repeat protein